ncbi:unnamed protein product, partial [Iphiclides podalirius]
MQVLAESSEEGMACEALFNDTLNDCCDSKFLFDDSSESTKCKNSKDEEELSCDDYKCLLEEDDLLVGEKISEGNVNKMLDKWENEYPKEKPMIDRARSECLGGKYLEYINEENCVPLKFYTCLYINSIIECQTWKTDVQCRKMKEYALMCKTLQDSK